MKILLIAVLLIVSIVAGIIWDSEQRAYAQVAESTPVYGRYYCIAGDQPISGNYFQAGHIDISAQSFDLWCEAVY